MSTLSEREEAVLRRALGAAASEIEPGSDGLDRIRGQLRAPLPLPLAWADAVRTDIVLGAPVAWDTFRERVSAMLRRLSRTLRPMVAHAWRVALDRFAPPRRSEHSHRAPTALGWLRPLAAFVTVVFIVAAGTYIGLDAAGVMSPGGNPQANYGQTGGSHSPSAPGGGSAAVSGSSRVLPTGTARRPTASPSPSCSPTSAPKASGSTSPQPIVSPSPSDSTTPATSTSPSVTPSASGSTSAGAGADSGTSTPDVKAGASVSSARTTAEVTSSPCGKKKRKTSETHNPTASAAGDMVVTVLAGPAGRLRGQ